MKSSELRPGAVDLKSDHRTTPVHTISKIFAKDGHIIICGRRGEAEVEERVTIREGLARATSVMDIIKAKKTVYGSDERELQKLVDMWIKAIVEAKKQLGSVYKSVNVSFALSKEIEGNLATLGSKVVKLPVHKAEGPAIGAHNVHTVPPEKVFKVGAPSEKR